MELKDKNILLGVTGGIAAYKAPGICSLLSKQGANVKVIMTEAAQKFVSKLTFQTMSRNLVYTDMFEEYPQDAEVAHIQLAKWADIFVIAPASANSIAKFANGIGDNLLSATFLAARSKIMIVPAMNTFMLNNPATKENMQKLRNRGIEVLGTHFDLLACNDVGSGKMLEPEEIVEEIDSLLREKDLAGKNVLVTAGPTIEAIDPVRYLTNHSSGKMGYALAEEAQKRGANVTLISGPTSLSRPKVSKFISVISSLDMYQAVTEHFITADIVVKAAAPADYRPKEYHPQKIKKETGDEFRIELERNPDILKLVAAKKQDQIMVGFAAESENELANAMAKLTGKNLDMIIVNNIKAENAGFQSDTNVVTTIDKHKNMERIGEMPKTQLAKVIWDKIKRTFL
ncbi:bifunctional phosphopantothenoylcysteine decarboxylase/phosphopantothenate--cysteine ligase CoaBC [Clostridiales bacterium COT073_COT-073]|nr:bifunctional phosphopantothenoylcysteine decarboxylase/phosphopantothenate--cysteine ligase CoaBC [Clostridiales bacterium COT073_COT-073]